MGHLEKIKKLNRRFGTGRDQLSKYTMIHHYVGLDEWNRIANDPNDCFHNLIPKHLRFKTIGDDRNNNR